MSYWGCDRPRYARHVKFGTTLEREDVRMGIYLGWMTYELEVKADVDPPEGDDWNEPRLDAGAWIDCDAKVCSVVIGYEDVEENPVELEGPPACRVVLPGDYLRLTDKEMQGLEREAIEESLVRGTPDPDDRYEAMQELRYR